jgi:thiol:disulfide interchange protein DsbG
MRSVLAYSLTSILFIPALAAANPHCATADPTAFSGGGPVPSASRPPPTSPSALSASLNSIPFVRHIAAAGAAITDLGTADGMRQIAARSGDQFMLFDVAPDGNAAVSGVSIDLSLVQLKSVAVNDITDLGLVHGLEAYFVRSGSIFQVFYATPDNQRVIPGVLWDASGKNLTKAEIQNIPGAVPTVTVDGPDGAQAAPADVLAMMQNATSGTIGNNPTRHV